MHMQDVWDAVRDRRMYERSGCHRQDRASWSSREWVTRMQNVYSGENPMFKVANIEDRVLWRESRCSMHIMRITAIMHKYFWTSIVLQVDPF